MSKPTKPSRSISEVIGIIDNEIKNPALAQVLYELCNHIATNSHPIATPVEPKKAKSAGDAIAERCIPDSIHGYSGPIHWTHRRLNWPTGGIVEGELSLSVARNWLASCIDYGIAEAFKEIPASVKPKEGTRCLVKCAELYWREDVMFSHGSFVSPGGDHINSVESYIVMPEPTK